MEKPKMDFGAMYSFLTRGSENPATTDRRPPSGSCVHELSISGFDGKLKYICIAMLLKKGPFVYYEPCKFDNGQCPVAKYIPHSKIKERPLDIEKKWQDIKSNNLK